MTGEVLCEVSVALYLLTCYVR